MLSAPRHHRLASHDLSFGRPRVLFLSYRFPYPLIGGDRIKAFHLIRHLSENAHVDLIALDEANCATEENVQHVTPYANVKVVPFDKMKAGKRIVKSLMTDVPIEFAYYNDPVMQHAVDEALATHKYDLIICFFLRTAGFVTLHTSTPKLLVAEDARVVLQERASEKFEFGPQYFVRKIDATKLRAYEPKVMKQGFERVTFVSRADERRILASDPSLPTDILSNGVSLKEYEFSSGEREDKIVFSGHLGTYHNILMAERLLKDIYPKIREVSPRTKLSIIGKSPGKDLQRLVERTAGAELHPDVKDVRPFLRSSKVFCHPQTVGAGIQNKLLEAMGIGTPVVTTPIGAAGIQGLEDNVNALVRISDQEIIEATLSLLKNDEKANRLATNARQLIEAQYTWEHVYDKLDSIISELVPTFFGDLQPKKSLVKT